MAIAWSGEYCGHGVGQEMHEEPQVLHYGRPGEGAVLQEGMVFTIEPMVNQGDSRIKTKKMAGRWLPAIKNSPRNGSTPWPSPPTVLRC